MRDTIDQYARASARARYVERNAARIKAARKKHLLIAVGVIAAVIAVAAVGVSWYLSHLNEQVTTDDIDLLESLAAHSEEDPFYLLLLGVDKGEERYDTEGEDFSNYRADTIMLCRIDPTKVKATIVSIHRDLLCELPNGTMGKINANYSLGGPSGMVDAISELAGVDIHHYAEIDFDSFMGIVDAIGGVEVTLPVAVSDPEYTELELPAGTQVLNGHDALMLSRTRHAYDEYGDGDVFRAANQRMVIASIVRKVLASDPMTMMSAVSSMAESVTTDMSVQDIVALAAKMRDFDPDTDLYTAMTPTEPVILDEIYYEQMDTDTWDRMMDRMKRGLAPYESEDQDRTAGIAGSVVQGNSPVSASTQDADPGDGDTPDDAPAEASSDPATALDLVEKNGAVGVYSISGGGATAYADDLASHGFNAVACEDPGFWIDENVVVYLNPAFADEAQAIADYLGEPYEPMLNNGSWVQTYDILVRIRSW